MNEDIDQENIKNEYLKLKEENEQLKAENKRLNEEVNNQLTYYS